jgi:hypothetical protein
MPRVPGMLEPPIGAYSQHIGFQSQDLIATSVLMNSVGSVLSSYCIFLVL